MNYATDRAWLYGDSTTDANSPNGLVKQAGVQAYNFGAAGAAGRATSIKLDAMRSMIALQPIETKRSWLMSALAEGTLQTTYMSAIDPSNGTETVSLYGGTIIDDDDAGMLLGFPYLTAKQIKIRTMDAVKGSDIFLGDWATTGICYFTPAVEIVPNIYGAAYASGGIELICFQDVDVFALDPARFVLAQDLELNQQAAPVVP